jgi:hypothetical protein
MEHTEHIIDDYSHHSHHPSTLDNQQQTLSKLE